MRGNAFGEFVGAGIAYVQLHGDGSVRLG